MTVGCVGSGTGAEGITPAQVQRITRTAVFGTATVWTIKKPDSKPAFEAALGESTFWSRRSGGTRPPWRRHSQHRGPRSPGTRRG